MAVTKGFMRILLQNKGTRDYVDRLGGWTWKEGRARAFSNGLEAIMFCFDQKLNDMQIACSYADLGRNFKVPVTDHRHSF